MGHQITTLLISSYSCPSNSSPLPILYQLPSTPAIHHIPYFHCHRLSSHHVSRFTSSSVLLPTAHAPTVPITHLSLSETPLLIAMIALNPCSHYRGSAWGISDAGSKKIYSELSHTRERPLVQSLWFEACRQQPAGTLFPSILISQPQLRPHFTAQSQMAEGRGGVDRLVPL